MANAATAEMFRATDRFAVQRQVGSGGMGVVWEALDRDLNTTVAIKTLRQISPEALLRFKNEFRSLCDIHHPNLVRLGELIEHRGQWFFTMELVCGVQFLEHVRSRPIAQGEGPALVTHSTVNLPARGQSRSLVSPEALDLPQPAPVGYDEARLRLSLRQLAEGIFALHEAGKIHRDIKPSNILVTNEGRVVILDFGIVTDFATERVLSNHPIVGTAAYMAPEQAAGVGVGPEADWYSVGVMLYQALTGRLPFTGSLEELIEKKLAFDPVSPRTIVPQLPADLDQLCVELLRRDPTGRPSRREILSRLGALAPRAATRSDAPVDVFVGRAPELDKLQEAFDCTRKGQAVAAYVVGESGVGKSALVRRFCDSVCSRSSTTIRLEGRCHERESVPYKAVDGVIDALSRELGRLGAAELTALVPDGAWYLTQVFPVLQRVPALAAAPSPTVEVSDPKQLQLRFFAALRELLEKLTRLRPVIVSIDDFQWADADSRNLLTELMRPPDAPSLLIVATVRSELPKGVEWMRAISPTAREIELHSLSASDAKTLIDLLVDKKERSDPSWTATILAESGGHPLFIDELIRHRRVTAQSQPLRLDEVLWARIGCLSEKERELLELLSVAGTGIRQDTLVAALGIEYGAFASLVVALGDARLVRTNGIQRGDSLESYHDRVRESVLAHLDEARQKGLHRQLALTFEANGGSDAEGLAIHWQGAGESARAKSYAVVAAEQAFQSLAFNHAARLYRLALDLTEVDDAAPRRELAARLGDALANAGRGSESAQAYLTAAETATSDTTLDLRRRAAEQLLSSGHIDEALETIKKVLDSVGLKMAKTPTRALMSLLLRRSQLWARGLGYRRREIEKIPKTELRNIDVCCSMAVGLAIVDTVRGADFQARNLLLALRCGELNRIARALGLELGFTAPRGGPARARCEVLKRLVMDAAHQTKDSQAVGIAIAAVGMSAYMSGRWNEALGLFEQAEAILRDRCTGVAWELNSTRLFSLATLGYLGRLKEQTALAFKHSLEARSRGNLFADTNLRTRIVHLSRLIADQPDLARQEIAQGMKQWSRRGFHVQHTYAMLANTRVSLYEGDGDRAYRDVLESWPGLRRSMLLRVNQLMRVESIQSRGASALAKAVQSKTKPAELLRSVRRDANALVEERMPWATPLGILLESGASVDTQNRPLMDT